MYSGLGNNRNGKHGALLALHLSGGLLRASDISKLGVKSVNLGAIDTYWRDA